jgi:hypothetical protein
MQLNKDELFTQNPLVQSFSERIEVVEEQFSPWLSQNADYTSLNKSQKAGLIRSVNNSCPKIQLILSLLDGMDTL